MVVGIPATVLIYTAPPLLTSLLLILTLVMTRKYGLRISALSVWLVIMADWAGLTYLGPEGFGFILVLILLVTVMYPGSRVMVFLVTAALAITHPLAALVAGAFLAFTFSRSCSGQDYDWYKRERINPFYDFQTEASELPALVPEPC